ncbi:MAG: chemotaxis protein CheD [Candidatus Saccharibacteria bacterium]
MDEQGLFLQPGFIYASHEHKLLYTVLGSCVSVCLWDKQGEYGGMNHFIFPQRGKHSPSARYGDVAVRYLIKLMQELGSHKHDLMAHIIGGATNQTFNSNIGLENAVVAEEALTKAGIEIVTRDVGGTIGKKLVFNTASGEVLVYKSMRVRKDDWYK